MVGWQFVFQRMRNLFLGFDISLYASVGIISKHSLHISTISQNKKLIHSQHDSPKLSRSMSTPGIFIFKSHGRHFLFAKSVIYKCSLILVLIYICSFFTVTNTTSPFSNTFPKINLTKHALKTPYFLQYCNIGEYSCVWSKSADVCLYLPNRPGVNKANICRNPVGKLANN